MRFSFKTFMLFLIVSATVIGLAAYWVGRRSEGLSEIRASGGQMFSAQAEPLSNLQPFMVHFPEASNFNKDAVASVAGVHGIETLSFRCGSESLPDFSPLADSKSLYTVIVENADDRIFVELRKVPHLKRIKISGVSLEGRQIAELEGLKQLTSLDLSYTSVDDQSAKSIGKLESLRHLTVKGTLFGDRGVEEISNLTRLKTLDLSETAVSPKSIVWIARMSNLQKLRLLSTSIDESDCRPLNASSQVMVYVPSRSPIVDGGIKTTVERPHKNSQSTSL